MSDLDRLAELYGIEPHYVDVWGDRHDISPETKAAILDALGQRTASSAEIAESLHRADERLWKRLLPAAVVCTAGAPILLDLTVPAASSGQPIEWHLRTETGDERRGDFTPVNLPRAGETSLDGEPFERYQLALPPVSESGYHRLELGGAGATCTTNLIVCPSRCYSVADAVGDEVVWGLSLQLYGLRSDTDWGIGDFSDLAAFAGEAAGFGASLIGVNPLHAVFPAEPRHFSPYSPSSREFLNPLYLDVERIVRASACDPARELAEQAAFAERKENARRAELVDYPTVSQLKMATLEHAYACFREAELDNPAGGADGKDFRQFQQKRGAALRRHAIFEALHEHFYRQGEGVWSWRHWPGGYRDCDSAEVSGFERSNLERVEFYEYLQWLCDRQLADAQARAVEGGMPIGLYCDLAVAVHPDGGTAWSCPEALVSGVSVGAPPDELGPEGQNWGLAPLSPVGLQETGYAAFVSALRANMRHSGAVRIDHVMGLQRLFWIPHGMRGSEGAYVHYPFQDLLGIVALESQRNRCVVIGEDLGTVAEGFREALQAAGILSYRVLMFEREDDGSFRKPEDYPTDALVTASTHDLPTVAGFRAGRDIDWRQQLGHYDDIEAEQGARSDRVLTTRLLDTALASSAAGDAPSAEGPHLYLAHTPSKILMVQAEDLVGEIEQPNLPGTHEEHPNWRRKLSAPLREIFARPATRSLFSSIARVRPRASTSR